MRITRSRDEEDRTTYEQRIPPFATREMGTRLPPTSSNPLAANASASPPSPNSCAAASLRPPLSSRNTGPLPLYVMYIKEITVENYKGFNEPQRASWEPGFNILVGKNNAGKSSLIDAAELLFIHLPHLGVATRPDPDIPLAKPSTVDIVFSLSRQELLIYLKRLGNAPIQVVCPQIGSDVMNRLEARTSNIEGLQKAVDWIFSQEKFSIRLRRQSAPGQGANWVIYHTPSFGLFELQGNNVLVASCALRPDGKPVVHGVTNYNQPVADFGQQIAEFLRNDIHRFSAERFSLGKSSIGSTDCLLKMPAISLRWSTT